MAETRRNQKVNVNKGTDTQAAVTTAAPTVTAVKYEPLNLDEKVTVRSISESETTFARKADGVGDILIMPNGSVRLSRNEIIAQVQSGNALFNGTDGEGSHAVLIIEDEATRREVGFETDDKKQNVFSDEMILNIFSEKNFETFKKLFTEHIVTNAEKHSSIEAIKRLGINDYAKIRFAETYTEIKM